MLLGYIFDPRPNSRGLLQRARIRTSVCQKTDARTKKKTSMARENKID